MADSFIGAGDIYLDRLVNGASTGLKKVAVGKLEIKPNMEKKEQISKGRDTYGQTLAAVYLNKPAEASMTLTQVDRKALTMAFLGEDADINDTATVHSNLIITAYKDSYSQLETAGGIMVTNLDIVAGAVSAASGALIVTNASGTVTYSNTSDYTVSALDGMLFFPTATTSITNTQILHIDCKSKARTGYTIEGAVNPTISARTIMKGKNLANGDYVNVLIHEIALSPDSAVDFLKDDFNELELSGTMITPAGKDSPFIVDVLDPT
jgi:hypothetical protein